MCETSCSTSEKAKIKTRRHRGGEREDLQFYKQDQSETKGNACKMPSARIFSSLCVRVWCMFTLVCAHVCGGQRLISGMTPWSLSTCLLSHHLNWDGWPRSVSGICLLCQPSAGVTNACHQPGSLCGCWGCQLRSFHWLSHLSNPKPVFYIFKTIRHMSWNQLSRGILYVNIYPYLSSTSVHILVWNSENKHTPKRIKWMYTSHDPVTELH